MISIKKDMTIINIHNQQIELTEDEAYELYLELQKKYYNKDLDKDAIKKFIDDMRRGNGTYYYPNNNHPTFIFSAIPIACQGCGNHPSNGGSGICQCTLGNVVSY